MPRLPSASTLTVTIMMKAMASQDISRRCSCNGGTQTAEASLVGKLASRLHAVPVVAIVPRKSPSRLRVFANEKLVC
jgi:hypothetical protein